MKAADSKLVRADKTLTAAAAGLGRGGVQR
jgi:hypothetical protein